MASSGVTSPACETISDSGSDVPWLADDCSVRWREPNGNSAVLVHGNTVGICSSHTRCTWRVCSSDTSSSLSPNSLVLYWPAKPADGSSSIPRQLATWDHPSVRAAFTVYRYPTAGSPIEHPKSTDPRLLSVCRHGPPLTGYTGSCHCSPDSTFPHTHPE